MVSKFRSYVTGFIAGGLVGGLITLLYTPKSGKELRHDFAKAKKHVNSTLKQLQSESLELKDHFIQLKQHGTETIKNVAKELHGTVDSWKNDIEPHLKSLQHEVNELKEKAERAVRERDTS